MASRPAPVNAAGQAYAPPAGALDLTIATMPAGQLIHRVHEQKHTPLSFNPGFGWARFSPIADASGKQIPTIYGGFTFRCALLETVFHDVAYAPGFKQLGRSQLDDLVHSVIRPLQDLRLVDLGTVALRKLGSKRNQIVDTESTEYAITQAWAARFHAQDTTVQGIRWTSRQDDQSFSVVLFGDRIDPMALVEAEAPRALLTDAYAEVVGVADEIGVMLVDATI